MTEDRSSRDPFGPINEDEIPIPTDDDILDRRSRPLEEGPAVSARERAQASDEQMLYARILAAGMYIGLGVLLLTFALYLTGVLSPAVPIRELANYWTLPAHEYLEAINHEFLHRDHIVDGWSWVYVLNRGDYLNFVGIALLALVTIGCYLGILPMLLRKRDWIYATIAVLEVVILALAASGIVAVGH
jgi:hypothetical protein